jgi:GH43 family beta-xylosidase
VFFEGNYYLLTTTWTSQLVMRKSPTLKGLGTAAPVHVWSDTNADRCCNFWAFEMHRLNGPNGLRWYIMYTAGVSANLDGQKLRVLESSGSDPMGPYVYRGTPMPNTWNIDGSYMQLNGNLYLLWSEWIGSNQSIWIAQMSNPWTITGSKVVISQPSFSWETQGGNTNEAPEVLQRNGQTHIVYSASSCNTQYYKLGLLTLTGSNPLSASSWTKAANPVFQAANGVYGPGHNGFFKSPNGTEDWLVYHGNATSSQGCGDTRSTRAQRFTWNSNNTPNFGSPVSTSTSLAVPAGEMGPITAAVQGVAFNLINQNAGVCAGVTGSTSADGANVALQGCASTASQWVLDPTADGYYRLVNKASGKSLGVADCSTADGGNVHQYSWNNNRCQQWQLMPTADGWFRLNNRYSGRVLDAANCGGDGGNVQQWSWQNNACQQWRLQPVGTVAISSAVSGKVLDVVNCSTASGTDIVQWEFLNTACQKWNFTHIDNGFYEIRPTHAPGSCMAVNSSDVIQSGCGNSSAQWRIEPIADGSIRFVSRNNARSLDVSNCALANGTDVVHWDWLNNICQRFSLLSVN